MAARGQRFNLDTDADNFTFNFEERNATDQFESHSSFVREIKERDSTSIPPPPKPKQSKTGFPQHRPPRFGVSAFRQRQQQKEHDAANGNASGSSPSTRVEPSDRAIAHHLAKKHGYDPEAKSKADISDENKRRLAQMSTEEIEQARSELMSNLSPAFIERLLRRANIEEDRNGQEWNVTTRIEERSREAEAGIDLAEIENNLQDQITHGQEQTKHGNEHSPGDESGKRVRFKSSEEENGNTAGVLEGEDEETSSLSNQEENIVEPQFEQIAPSVHFPRPPRNPDNYVELNPDSSSFLSDLKKHYFPELPDNPSTLSWLQDPTDEDSRASPYAPTQSRYSPSDIRFDFNGRLIAPNDSRDIATDKGLHHHGQAPESAGYTIPELSILARSSLANQRSLAYQVLGRILYRLGRGDFGPRGSELQEGLWGCVEKERPVEVMMSEANRTGGHLSAKAHATEALWLWRKGGGGERGVLKAGEKLAK